VEKILAKKYVKIGTDVIEGKPVRGVELRDPSLLLEERQKMPPQEDFPEDFAARFWIDVQTQLPVRMEISFILKGSPVRTTQILDQFEWGVPLAESLFAPEIPADYEVHDHDPAKTPSPDPCGGSVRAELWPSPISATSTSAAAGYLPCPCLVPIRTLPGHRCGCSAKPRSRSPRMNVSRDGRATSRYRCNCGKNSGPSSASRRWT
jgi:hypothetical protein